MNRQTINFQVRLGNDNPTFVRIITKLSSKWKIEMKLSRKRKVQRKVCSKYKVQRKVRTNWKVQMKVGSKWKVQTKVEEKWNLEFGANDPLSQVTLWLETTKMASWPGKSRFVKNTNLTKISQMFFARISWAIWTPPQLQCMGWRTPQALPKSS